MGTIDLRCHMLWIWISRQWQLTWRTPEKSRCCSAERWCHGNRRWADCFGHFPGQLWAGEIPSLLDRNIWIAISHLWPGGGAAKWSGGVCWNPFCLRSTFNLFMHEHPVLLASSSMKPYMVLYWFNCELLQLTNWPRSGEIDIYS